MKPNEIETYSKSIIGKLIDQLGTNTSAKAAFLTFDKDSSRSKNISSLDSSKHRVDTLESIATLSVVFNFSVYSYLRLNERPS